MPVDPPPSQLRIGAPKATYVIFWIIGLIPVCVFVLAGLRTGNGWKEAAEFAVAPAFLVLWVSAFRVEVASGILSYRTLFRGARSLPLSEIQSAEIAIAPDAPFGPFVQLRLHPHADSGLRPLAINAKVFSRADLNRLIDILGPTFKGPKPRPLRNGSEKWR